MYRYLRMIWLVCSACALWLSTSICHAGTLGCLQNQEVVLTGSTTLTQSCIYNNVTFKISTSDVTLDCNNASLRGGTTGYAINVVQPSGRQISNIVARNCHIEGYERGINVEMGISTFADELAANSNNPNWTYEQKLAANLAVADRIREAGPLRVGFDNVHIKNSSEYGMKIGRYLSGVIFLHGSITVSGRTALYITAGSKNNLIMGSTIAGGKSNSGQGVPTIALDSSALNLIGGNLIYGPVHVFKNCHEHDDEPNTNPARGQHAYGNAISGNTFRGGIESAGGRVAVWIAPRTSVQQNHCNDPIYYRLPAFGIPYWRDYAEWTLVEGNRFEAGTRVIAGDDDAQIKDNVFTREAPVPSSYIEAGSLIRGMAGEPVIRVVTINNTFEYETTIVPVDFSHGTVPTPGLTFSYDGPIAGQFCTQILEPSDPDGWDDNYLCSNRDIGLRYSYAGPISGMYCTKLAENSEPASHAWADNYICQPSNYPMKFRWSMAHPIDGMRCTSFNEPGDPHTWADNYLCL